MNRQRVDAMYEQVYHLTSNILNLRHDLKLGGLDSDPTPAKLHASQPPLTPPLTQPQGRSEPNGRKRWTEEEEGLAKTLALRGVHERTIAATLDRTPRAVEKRLRELLTEREQLTWRAGSRKRQRQLWSDYDRKRALDMARNGTTCERIAVKLDRLAGANSVKAQLRKLMDADEFHDYVEATA